MEQHTHKNEVRSFAIEPTVEKDSRTIRGVAIRFNEESVELCFGDLRFREVISSDAITPETLANSDIKAYTCHNIDKLLARSNMGSGTLKLELREDGLYFEFEAPHTAAGDEALELIRRGDIRACSFAFWDALSTWEEMPDGTYLRTITSLPHLDDISIVVTPAYTCTEVSVRGLDKMKEEKPDLVPSSYYNDLEASL